MALNPFSADVALATNYENVVYHELANGLYWNQFFYENGVLGRTFSLQEPIQ